MEKQKLLLAAIEDVKNAVDNLEIVIKAEDKPIDNQDKLKEKKAITLEHVREILTDKSKAGFSNEIKSLIKDCGADKLTDVSPKHYQMLLDKVEAM